MAYKVTDARSRNDKYSSPANSLQLSLMHVSTQTFHVVSEIQFWLMPKLPDSIRESDGQLGTVVLTLQ